MRTTLQCIRRGFTLLELMVAVAITSIIIVVLISMTGVVTDAWREGNNKIFTNSESRAAFSRLGEDLQNAIIRTNIKDAEWFVATKSPGVGQGNAVPANPTWLMFFSTPTDRQLFDYKPASSDYDKTKPIAGDVIALSYRIVEQDPVSGSSTSDYKLYGLYRAFPAGGNPAKITFDSALGKPSLNTFWSSRAEPTDKDNFYISNIFDFSFTFWISHYGADGKQPLKTEAVKPGSEIRLTSENLYVGSQTYPAGKLASVDISMTILTKEGAQRVREDDIPNNDIKSFVAKPQFAHTYAHKVYFAPEAKRKY